MKALALILALASIGHATVNGTTPIEKLNGGLTGASLVPVGTPVYALNNALTGSASAAIDLSGTAGLIIGVTSTGAANVTVYFSNQAVSQPAGALSMYSINANGSYPIEIKGRYVSFYNSSNQAANRVSVNYLPMVSSPVSASIAPGGSVNAFITGTVKVDAQGSSVVAYSTSTTAQVLAYLVSSYVMVSRTAFLVTTSGLAVNISTTAGVSCNDCRAYCSTRDASGYYWDYGNHAEAGTIPAVTALGSFTAASVTATMDDGIINGRVVFLRPTGASSVNVFMTVLQRQ